MYHAHCGCESPRINKNQNPPVILTFCHFRVKPRIQHRDGKIHKNSDGLSRWSLPNDPSNPAYNPEDKEDDSRFPIMGIHVFTFKTEFFELVKEGYSGDKNSVILTQLLAKENKDNVLSNALQGTWK